MLPYYLIIGDVKLPSYGLMIAIGIVVSVFLMSKNATYRLRKLYPNTELSQIKSRLPKPEQMVDFTVYAVLFGIIGGKLLYLLPNLREIKTMGLMELITNGFVIYGAVIGGAFGGYLYCRRKKLDALSCFDTIFPFVSLAQSFGRVGCFMAGCCYGKETTSAIGVVFKSEFSLAPRNVSLVPTQLISSLGNFVIFLILFFLSRKITKRGMIFACYMILYSLGRFFIEFYRGDSIRGFIGSLSTSQFISIFVFTAGLVTLLVSMKAKDNEYLDVDRA